MLRSPRSRSLARALLVVSLGGAGLGGCQPAGSGSETASPSPLVTASPSPTAAVVDGGTITLTDDDCAWAGNPGSMLEGRLTLDVRNETDDYALFIVHRIRDGRTWDEGQDAIAAIQEALETKTDWPEWVFDVSDALVEVDADAGADDVVSLDASPGTYGVVCSANTSPTGDVLTTFLVGPLEVTNIGG